MAGTGFTGGLRVMVLMQRRARRAALSGCRCRDSLFGGRPGRRPRASEMKKKNNKKMTYHGELVDKDPMVAYSLQRHSPIKHITLL